MKKKRAILFVTTGVIFVLLFSFSVLFSSVKFHTPNVFSAAYGLAAIAGGKSYQQIRNNPGVYLAKPENAQNNLIEMMAEKGYRYEPDKRLGSGLTFARGGKYQYVHFKANGYYSVWEFYG